MGVDVGTAVDELVELGLRGLDDRLVGVAGVRHRDPGEDVEVLGAVVVDERATVGALDGDVERLPDRHEVLLVRRGDVVVRPVFSHTNQ